MGDLSVKNEIDQNNFTHSIFDCNDEGVNKEGSEVKPEEQIDQYQYSEYGGEAFSQNGYFKTSYLSKPTEDTQMDKKLHSGPDKPYQCNRCDRAFITNSKLQEHIRIHTGDKPYQCSHCNKGFSYVTDLRTHMLSHTLEKPHQ